jgi:hypothetical protein
VASPAAYHGYRLKAIVCQVAQSNDLSLHAGGLSSEISMANPLTDFHASVSRHSSGELLKCRYRHLLHSCHSAELKPTTSYIR